MGGFKNDVVFGKNADFSAANNLSPSESNGLITDGQLWIGSTATNVGGSHVNVANITSPDGSIQIINGPGSIGLKGITSSKDLHTARFIVSAGGFPDGANYTTITSALTAASTTGGNQTVFVQPGTYTENITLPPGINLSAYNCDATTPNVTIVGTCTMTAAGTVSISGIRLQTNSAFALAVTGNAASIVNLLNCHLNCSNNTGISFTSSSASAAINIYNCIGNLGTTGIAYFAHSSSGALTIYNSNFGNSGSSSTSSTISAGVLQIRNCILFSNTITTSGSSAIFNVSYSQINGVNNTAIVHNCTASGSTLLHVNLGGGTATALTIGASATLSADFLTLQSSNTSAMSGAGTLSYGDLIYTDTSANNQITNNTALPGTGWQLIKSLTASASASLEFKDLALYKVYAIVFNNVVIATNAQKLELTASVNNGGAYANSGYTGGVNYNSYNSTTYANVNATTFAPMSSNVAAGFGVHGTVYYNYVSGQYYGQAAYLSSDTSVEVNAQIVGSTGLSNTNAFKFLSSSGNLTSGTISIYGVAI